MLYLTVLDMPEGPEIVGLDGPPRPGRARTIVQRFGAAGSSSAFRAATAAARRPGNVVDPRLARAWSSGQAFADEAMLATLLGAGALGGFGDEFDG